MQLEFNQVTFCLVDMKQAAERSADNIYLHQVHHPFIFLQVPDKRLVNLNTNLD